jgi:hypothetical protein
LCGYNLRRPHLTCMFCRLRRYFYGKMDKKKYHYNRYMKCVLLNNPADMEQYMFPLSDDVFASVYIILIDKTRKLAKVKDIPLKKLLAIAEKYKHIHFIRKHTLTICEGLAN